MSQMKNNARKTTNYNREWGVEDRKEKRFASWKTPDNMPDDTIKRETLKEALKIASKVVMESHVYILGNDIKLQRKGRPKGLHLTGTLAHILCCGGIVSLKPS